MEFIEHHLFMHPMIIIMSTSGMYVVLDCSTGSHLVLQDLTCFFAVVGLDAADVPWLFAHEDVGQARQAPLELGHHLIEWHQSTMNMSSPAHPIIQHDIHGAVNGFSILPFLVFSCCPAPCKGSSV